MRAMLVIEMPDMCNECPMCNADTGFMGDITRSECRIMKRDNLVYMDGTGLPEWCPLKALPERQKVRAGTGGYTRGFTAGFNKFRYLLTGDTE